MIINRIGSQDGLKTAMFHDHVDGSGFFSQHSIVPHKGFGDSKWFYSAPARRASRLATISCKF